MHWIILLLVFLAIFYLPQWWVKHTLRRYEKSLDRIPGTGGELARHLLDRFDLQHVKVEKTPSGSDHYDPSDQIVRLSENLIDQRSLTAVAVAAHEVGHAIQDAQGHPLLQLRTRLVTVSQGLQQLASIGVVIAPLLALLSRSPAPGILMIALSFIAMLSAVVIHLVTLPVELDASFNKALPILQEGYIEPADQKAVERILKAAALTYVASSVGSLLSIWRWFKLLRR